MAVALAGRSDLCCASPAFSPRAPRGGRRSRRRAQAAVVASGSERCLGWRQACDS